MKPAVLGMVLGAVALAGQVGLDQAARYEQQRHRAGRPNFAKYQHNPPGHRTDPNAKKRRRGF